MIDWQDAIELERNCREMESDDFLSEETEAQARDRMSPKELAEDDEYQALLQRRSQPLKERAKRNAWGTWKKRAGVAARKGRAGG